jgi:glycosyltransferase involved in cell wall biosynthesis
MLRAIVRRWVNDGHQVDVLSSQPSYKVGVDNHKQPAKEFVDGVQVVRLNLPPETGRPVIRVINALRLGLAVFWQAVVRQRYDVIMVSTSPPVVAGWFGAIAARLTGARFIYHCMDIHPEIGGISGEFSNPQVFSLMSRLDRWTCAQASPVVVLSEDMSHTLKTRESTETPLTYVINNFSLPSDKELSVELPFPWPEEPFVLLFAGNIGRFQGLDILVDAMAKLIDRADIRLVMMGEGSEKDRLAQKAKQTGSRISFVGHHSVEVAKVAMARASAGFISLVPELYRYAYPSKTMTYLEQGCPVVVAVEAESRLARDVVDNEAGLAVTNGDVNSIVEAIILLADEPRRLNAMGQNALRFAALAFAPDVVLTKWSYLLKENLDV